MCKQKKSNPLLVRVIITTILIIAMAVTSAPIVHAEDISADTTANTINDLVVVSTKYDALENRLKELEKEEKENDVNLAKNQQMIVEEQVLLLYQKIDEINKQVDIYSNINKKTQNKINSKQTKLDDEHEKNMQKIKSVSESIVASCMQVIAQEDSISSVVNQMSMLSQIAANDQRVVSEKNQMFADKETAQNSLAYYEGQLAEFNTLLAAKRRLAYDYMLSNQIELKNVTVGILTEQTESCGLSFHVDDNNIVWVNPCEYKILSSPFGYRMHPIYGEWRMHNGVDLANNSETPIYATRSGVVIDVGYDSSSGYHVIIDHLDGYQSCYLHLYECPDLKEGDVVIIGDQIGLMGTTGVSTGPHLHFGIAYQGKWVDPMNYIGN